MGLGAPDAPGEGEERRIVRRSFRRGKTSAGIELPGAIEEKSGGKSGPFRRDD